jgi:hypothetical protein
MKLWMNRIPKNPQLYNLENAEEKTSSQEVVINTFPQMVEEEKVDQVKFHGMLFIYSLGDPCDDTEVRKICSKPCNDNCQRFGHQFGTCDNKCICHCYN